MPWFDPFSFSLVLVAILLEGLGNFVAYLLDLPEWRMPREYIRSEYEPGEFCIYLIRWVLDSYDTTFWFFGLLGSLVTHVLDLWRCVCKRSRHAQRPVDAALSLSHEELDALMGGYLEEILEEAAGNVEDIGSVARKRIDRLKTRLNESETESCDAQDTITDLQDANNTLQSQKTDLKMKLGAEQEARQCEAKKSSDAVAEMAAQMKRLSAEVATLQQRAEETEQALRKKENALKIANQQRESNSKLADERIKQLQEGHKSDLDDLRKELETTKRENRVQKDENSDIELERAELDETLKLERKSKAGLIKNMDEIKAEAKDARNKAQQWQQKCTRAEKSGKDLEQKVKDIEDAECAQCETLTKQAASDKQKLHKAKLFEEQHMSDRKTWEDKLAIARSEKQDLEKRLGDCQDALKRTGDSKDKAIMDDQRKHRVALEAKDKEHKDAMRSRNARIDNLEVGLREAEEKIVDHDKNMAHALVNIRAAESRFKNSENDLKNTQAKLETAQAELDGRTEQANDAYQAADKLWHEFEAIKATNEEILDASVTLIQEGDIPREERRELKEKLHRFLQDREAALEAQDDAQPCQHDDAAGTADENLEACHDYGADQTSREPVTREDELDHSVEPTAAFDDESAADSEIKELEAKGTVHGDGHNDQSSQHGSSQGESDGEDNDVSHPSQIDDNYDGNFKSAGHGDFDRLTVEQQRKARRRAKNQDMNKGGAEARMRRKTRQKQAQQVPHEQQAPVAAANNMRPLTNSPTLLQFAHNGHGGRHHQAPAQHWNDFANAAQMEYTNRSSRSEQPVVPMLPSGPRFQGSNRFRGGRGSRGRGR